MSEVAYYYRAVLKRLRLVLLLAGLVVGFVYGRMATQPPKYVGTTTLMITTQSLLTVPTTTATENQNNSAGAKAETTVTNSIVQLITSRPIAERVATKLSLGAPEQVRKSLQASKVSGTNLISIRASSTDRLLAPTLANEAATQFIDFFREANRRDARDVRLFIEQQLASTRARLDELDRQIESYKAKAGIADLSQAIANTTQDLVSTQQDAETTLLRLKEDEAKLAAAMARLAREKFTRITIQDIETNPVFAQLQTALTELEIQRGELSQKYTPDHPKIQLLREQIIAIRRRLASETRKILGKEQEQVNPVHDQLVQEIADLEIDRTAAVARLNALAFSERRRQAAVAALPGVEREFTALLRERSIYQENYSLLSERYLEALLRENEAGYVPAGVHVMEPAAVPEAPESGKLLVRLGIAVLLGLLLGIIAAVLLETSEDRIRSPQDAERTLGAPVLARVPNVASRKPLPVIPVLVVFLVLLAGLGTGAGLRLKGKSTREFTVDMASAIGALVSPAVQTETGR